MNFSCCRIHRFLQQVIIYEYNYTQSGSPNYDKIYTVAGKVTYRIFFKHNNSITELV